MLQNTFCHVPGIGLKTESRLWDAGIHSWDDFFKKTAPGILRGKLAEMTLEQSIHELASENPGYFARLLPTPLCWRLFPDFRSHAVYLDIETSGLDIDFHEITTIALYDGNTVRTYVNGINLKDFADDIRKYKVVITYNGKCFDIPFLERYFKIRMDQTQIDLRYVLGSLGYKGGLKNCEMRLGIDRGDLKGVDGFFSVLLWADYVRNKNQMALETLLAYNILDVVHLERLMILAYNQNLRNTPFAGRLEIPTAAEPVLPFQPHCPTIEKIRARTESIYFKKASY